jgi:para-nitrobenzyl esterase
VLDLYRPNELGGPDNALVAVFSDSWFVCPSDAIAATAVKSRRAPAWRFVYTHTYASSALAPVRAGHGMDLPLIFHNLVPSWGPFTDEEEAMSKQLVRYWARFAATGDPNAASDPQWPIYRYGQETVLKVDTPISLTGSQSRCGWWWAGAKATVR